MVKHDELNARIYGLRAGLAGVIEVVEKMQKEAPHVARFIDLDQFLARLDAARENLKDAKEILGVA